jgi:hypothetical protein
MVAGMDPAGVAERAGLIDAVCAATAADVSAVESALVAVRELAGWIEARRGVLVGKLAGLSSFPEATIAEVDMTSIGAAAKARQRSATLTATPNLAATLDDGATTAAHVDVVTRAATRLPEAQRGELFERVDALADVAAAATAEQFARRVDVEVKRIERDDGIDRLERQRRAVRSRSWVDGEGMWNLRGRFDPLTGVRLDAKLRATLEATFAEATPEHCPTDPVEKQQFLAAHALAALIEGATGRSRPGRCEFVVVIDADADPAVAGPVAEWSLPVEIPTRMLADLAGDADVHAVVVRNGVVLYAPGELDLGRSTRLANRAQRRALRGLYRGCAIPGCSVAYDRCKLHHVIWWRDGGRTDLANLVPVCAVHHAKIHHDGWTVELGPNRELTLRLPDGTVRSTGPPGRRAAA